MVPAVFTAKNAKSAQRTQSENLVVKWKEFAYGPIRPVGTIYDSKKERVFRSLSWNELFQISAEVTIFITVTDDETQAR